MGISAWIIVGLLAGWLATQILGGRGGLMYNLAVDSWARSSAASFLKNCGSKSFRISGEI
jgi:uncharacterized membrane protein YeaQ/YmgE (transglycosylase-associated protein family)